MSDFTKEELEIIITALSIHEQILCGNESHTRFSPLLKMIGRMIDNYPEHKECEHKEIVTGTYSRSDPPRKCDVCGSLYR